MLAFVAAVALALTPGEAFRLATYDLAFAVAPDRRPFTRYAWLNREEKARPAQLDALEFAANSTSFQSSLVRFPVVGDALLRIDLEELGWDRFNREDELARLETLGVKFAFRSERDRQFFLDIWETIAFADPYFRAPKDHGGRYAYERGWVAPEDDALARALSGSDKFIVRADWLAAKVMLERQDGGFYSQLLLLPAREDLLYKRLGVNLAFVDATAQARHGGAVVTSDVAIHNRELQVIPGAFGDVWRTFDFAVAGVKEKDIQLTLAGTAKLDGREIIWRWPNGLHGYYLADGKGTQVNVVPSNIAVDKRASASHPIVDRNVVNAYKCVSCHGPEGGIIPFKDVIYAAVVARGSKVFTFSEDHRRVVVRNKELREYYLSNLEARVAAEQAGYAAAVGALNGMDPGKNADTFVRAFDEYTWGVVTPEVAAREMGYGLERARELWLVPQKQAPQIAILHGGGSIRREAWELIFDDAMLAPVHPWEAVAPAAVKVKAGY